MKRILVLCFVLNAFCFSLDFSYTLPLNSTDFAAPPFMEKKTFAMGLFGEDVLNIADYGRIGAFAYWPIGPIQWNGFCEFTYLDSLYQRTRSRIGGAFLMKYGSAGASYLFSLETAKGFETLIFHGYLLNLSILYKRLIGSFTYGYLPGNLLFLSSGIALDLDNYGLYVELLQEFKVHLQIGHYFKMKNIIIEAAYRYPTSSFYIGLALSFNSWNVTIGQKAVSNHYSRNYWKLVKSIF